MQGFDCHCIVNTLDSPAIINSNTTKKKKVSLCLCHSIIRASIYGIMITYEHYGNRLQVYFLHFAASFFMIIIDSNGNFRLAIKLKPFTYNSRRHFCLSAFSTLRAPFVIPFRFCWPIADVHLRWKSMVFKTNAKIRCLRSIF